ncbi:hypothetical protein PENTCL1PPCAC_16493, partial [Pristionchus entomophagus]
IWPTRNSDCERSEKKRITCATSSGVPILPNGIAGPAASDAIIWSCISFVPPAVTMAFEFNPPGRTEFTRIPF